jgi:hypothetical protein
MHETGHNLGFGHSSENNMIRGDKSGSMGSSLFALEAIAVLEWS